MTFGDGAAAPVLSRRYRELARVRELQALMLASLVSSAGDVLAKYALAYLVFERTGSAARGALTFAVSFLSALVGGPLFAGVTDRLPARRVMVATDVVRGVGLLVMALIGGPLWLLVLLLFAATALEAPFDSSRSVVFVDVVGAADYTRAAVLDRIVYQGAQVLGFGGGSAVVALFGARPALALDAASFAVSAVVLLAFVRAREARESERSQHKGLRLVAADAAVGWTTVFRSVELRRATVLVWLAAGIGVAPEAVTVPLSLDLGEARTAGGILLVASPVCYIAASLFVASRSVAVQRRLHVPLTLLAGAPLLLFFLHPPFWVGVAVFGVTGIGLTSTTVFRTEVLAWTPPERLGRVYSTVGPTLLVIQGVATALLGLLAVEARPSDAIAVVGAVICLGAVVVVVATSRRAVASDGAAGGPGPA